MHYSVESVVPKISKKNAKDDVRDNCEVGERRRGRRSIQAIFNHSFESEDEGGEMERKNDTEVTKREDFDSMPNFIFCRVLPGAKRRSAIINSIFSS